MKTTDPMQASCFSHSTSQVISKFKLSWRPQVSMPLCCYFFLRCLTEKVILVVRATWQMPKHLEKAQPFESYCSNLSVDSACDH